MSASICPGCGGTIPAGAAECPDCGTPSIGTVAGERRVVTTLFVDLTRSTELSTQLDPERLHTVMTSFYRQVTEELSASRGRPESFAGDAVLGVFGLPQARDDDALRAVRAALAIRDRMARLGDDLRLPLQVRMGINTGPVAVMADPSVRTVVLGSTVNLAARLEQGASAGEILVGEATHSLTADAVEFGPERSLEAKGFTEPVPAWPVLSMRRTFSRRTIPLVDRRRELRLLRDTFERVRETRRGHLVTLSGEPGIGKTRLVDEFVSLLPDDVKVLTGRASSLDEEATFGPLADLLRRELEIEPDAPADETRRRLETAVADPCDRSEVDVTAARLGIALGINRASREARRYDVAEARAGFTAFLGCLARREPVIVVLDDLHLANEPFLTMVEEAVQHLRHSQVMVIVLARSELLDARPAWGAAVPDSLRLSLEPLPDEDAVTLAMCAGDGLTPDAARGIASRSGGNPFFIVETTGMLIGDDTTPSVVPIGPTPEEPIAYTVQAVVAARLDRLPDGARQLVRRASVFPQTDLELGDLAIVADPRPENLEILVDREVFVRDDPQRERWRFRHPLLRDVAYESLTKTDRRLLHAQVAAAEAPEGAAPRLRAIAFHLERAARAALDTDPLDRAPRDEAIAALTRAADQARENMDARGALDLYERAVDLAGVDPDRREEEAWLLAGIGEARYWLSEFDAARSSLARALELGGDDPRTVAQAARLLGDIVVSIDGDLRWAEELFERARRAARELQDPFVLARTLLAAGWRPYWESDWRGAQALFEEALSVARANPAGDAWAESRALTSLAVAVTPIEDEEEALAFAREALRVATEAGDRFGAAVASPHVANSLRRTWRLEEAMPYLDDAIRVFDELGARWELADATIARATVQRVQGDLGDAEVSLRTALTWIDQLGATGLRGWANEELAKVLISQRRLAEARAIVHETPAEAGVDEESMALIEATIDVVEGDPEQARERLRPVIDAVRGRPHANGEAVIVWWASRLLGPAAVGGDEAVRAAREHLERMHWEHALREPGLLGVTSSAEPDSPTQDG